MRTKTKDEIMKANLNRTLSRLKSKVADKEDTWLEMFQLFLECLVNSEGPEVANVERVKESANLADLALDLYEARWGASGKLV
jgi:hypothetical protein